MIAIIIIIMPNGPLACVRSPGRVLSDWPSQRVPRDPAGDAVSSRNFEARDFKARGSDQSRG